MPDGWQRRTTRSNQSSKPSVSKAATSATCLTATAWRRASKPVSPARRRPDEAALAEGRSVPPGQRAAKATPKPHTNQLEARNARASLHCSSILPPLLLYSSSILPLVLASLFGPTHCAPWRLSRARAEGGQRRFVWYSTRIPVSWVPVLLLLRVNHR